MRVGTNRGSATVTTALALGLAVLVVVPIALVVFVGVGSGPSPWLLTALGVWVLLVGTAGGALYRRLGDRDGDAGESADGTVWDAIPSWQYGGRHVESGGLTRDEQERALDEIRETANEIERRTRD